MPQNLEQSCHNCMYERNGQCRRYPPKIFKLWKPRDGSTSPGDETSTNWPEITSYAGTADWCGEWAQPVLVPDREQ